MKMDYAYCYLEEIKDVSTLDYDIFISGFDGSERTIAVYDKISAKERHWLVFPQYELRERLLPVEYLTSPSDLEDDYILEVMDKISIRKKSVCLDATGFIIPHLLFFIQYLVLHGVKSFDVLYSEPISYTHAEDTEFTKHIEMPRPIQGYMASPKNINGNDALVIFSGFDNTLVTTVAHNNSKAQFKYLFTGFPSLQADMYQQNMIQLYKSKETIGEKHITYLKAPAYDPFVAANKLQIIVNELMDARNNIEYIHISPLSTKPMAIAAALVYLNNRRCPIDIIYPPANTYVCGQTNGVKRTWKYTLEF